MFTERLYLDIVPFISQKIVPFIVQSDTINYAISNDGSNQLTIDPQQLRLITNGNQLSYTQTSLTNPTNAISSNLPAGKTEHGVILIMGVPKDTNVVLQWPMAELGTQNTWLVQENFN